MPDARSPIEMVKGMPAAAAPEEIDASDAGWLPAGTPAERGRVGTRPRESPRRRLGWAAWPVRANLRLEADEPGGDT